LSLAAGEAGDEGAKAEKKENALALETTTATTTTTRRRGRIFPRALSLSWHGREQEILASIFSALAVQPT
jgi:hypothetical protein